MTFDQMKYRLVRRSLIRHKGNRSRVAKELKLSTRTLRNWIQKYRLASEFPASRGFIISRKAKGYDA